MHIPQTQDTDNVAKVDRGPPPLVNMATRPKQGLLHRRQVLTTTESSIFDLPQTQDTDKVATVDQGPPPPVNMATRPKQDLHRRQVSIFDSERSITSAPPLSLARAEYYDALRFQTRAMERHEAKLAHPTMSLAPSPTRYLANHDVRQAELRVFELDLMPEFRDNQRDTVLETVEPPFDWSIYDPPSPFGVSTMVPLPNSPTPQRGAGHATPTRVELLPATPTRQQSFAATFATPTPTRVALHPISPSATHQPGVGVVPTTPTTTRVATPTPTRVPSQQATPFVVHPLGAVTPSRVAGQTLSPFPVVTPTPTRVPSQQATPFVVHPLGAVTPSRVARQTLSPFPVVVSTPSTPTPRQQTAITTSPMPSPASQRTPLNSPSVKQRKYFVVTVGRKTGVFDNWHIVSSLVSGISNAAQSSYRTHEEATAAYLDCKTKGMVKVRHLPGDDETVFGPESEAMQ